MTTATLNEQLMSGMASPAPAAYYPVSRTKFVLLAVLTLGLYEIYWFYKNWAYVRIREQSNIWPLARGIFAGLWYVPFLLDVNRHSPRRIAVGVVALLGVLYFVTLAVWRLPDPFWVVTMFSFVPLLPAVAAVNALNPQSGEAYRQNSRWKVRHWILAFFMAPLVCHVTASGVGLVPSTQVMPGWMLWGPSRAVLEDYEILHPGEKVEYFYSGGFLSFAEDGNLLTDRRVVSYWEAPDEEDTLYVESAEFAEIKRKDVEPGDWLDLTMVKITRHDDTEFSIHLSNEGKGDERFLRRLDERLRRARVQERAQ